MFGGGGGDSGEPAAHTRATIDTCCKEKCNCAICCQQVDAGKTSTKMLAARARRHTAAKSDEQQA